MGTIISCGMKSVANYSMMVESVLLRLNRKLQCVRVSAVVHIIVLCVHTVFASSAVGHSHRCRQH